MEILRNNSYPGRGIVVGKDRVYYFIMGRSANSRNRIFSLTDDGIRLHCELEKPEGSSGRLPLVLVFHGFTGHMEEPHIRAAAAAAGLRSVAFCCVSTGVFGYPAEDAARVAVAAVRAALDAGSPVERVVFDVFSARDESLYRSLLA